MPHRVATRNDVPRLRRPPPHRPDADPRLCVVARGWHWYHVSRAGLVLSREPPPAGVVAELASRLGEGESALLRVITALARLEPVSAEIAALAAVELRPAPPRIPLTALPVHPDAVGLRYAAIVDLLAEERLLAASNHRALRARTAEIAVLVHRWIEGGAVRDGRDVLALRIAG